MTPTKRSDVRDESDQLLDALQGLTATPKKGWRERLFDRYTIADGPIGRCFVVSSQSGVRHVFTTAAFDDDPKVLVATYIKRFERPLLVDEHGGSALSRALYAGNTKGARLDLSALTPFEQAVLLKTQEIPRGEVRPYGWIAAEIGAPRAMRAVGTALANNPVPFIVPCHRVVRSDGMIGNYGFGPDKKEAILRDEGVALLGRSTASTTLRTRLVASNITKVVCYPTCHSARRITPAHLIGFSSLHEAASAGFRPCHRCRPI